MSLSERLKKILATEEVEEEEEEKDVNNPEQGEGVEKATKADKPKLVRKQITLGARPINVDLSKEVKRFNK